MKRAGLCAALLATAAALGSTLHVRALATAAPERTSYMTARAEQRGEDTALYQLRVTPLHRVSPFLWFAVVTSEDANFLSGGSAVDWQHTAEAALTWFRDGTSIGASTIPQQLARNLYLWPERSVFRKALEAALAVEMTLTVERRRILEVYLSAVEWGDGVWGIQEASAHYFLTTPDRLGAFESAVLASVLPCPARAPDCEGSARFIGRSLGIVHTMYRAGMLSPEAREYEIAKLRWLHRELISGRDLLTAVRMSRVLTVTVATDECVQCD